MWHDVEQNTDEWLQLRAGKITGSQISKVMANYGKSFGDPAKALAVNIAVEQLSGKPISSDQFYNSHMERGHIEEPLARQAYEEMFFVDVINGGFYDNGNTGCSPDGNVCHDGLVEIKSAIASVHYERIKINCFDPCYKWQILFELRESEREWLDFISYCSVFPDGKKLFVAPRIYAADFEEDFKKINCRLDQFFEEVETIKKTILATRS